MSDGDISENIKVFIRARPASPSEAAAGISTSTSAVQGTEDGHVNHGKASFKFDCFFPATSSQESVYEQAAKPIVDTCLRGYSGTIFAYGSTGSGKTYTMLGGGGSDRGVLPRCIEHILSSTHGTAEISVSYLQIYCEMVGDLLSPSNGTLSIRERAGSHSVKALCEPSPNPHTCRNFTQETCSSKG